MLGASLAAILAAGAVRWRQAISLAETSAAESGDAAVATHDVFGPTLDSAADAIISNDPFRLANEPAAIRYDPSDESRAARVSVALPPPPPLRPTMTLKAIVGGPPWQAVVDGIPGRPPGTIVRSGSAFDRLVARRVTRDSVVIQGPDTVWVLTFPGRR